MNKLGDIMKNSHHGKAALAIMLIAFFSLVANAVYCRAVTGPMEARLASFEEKEARLRGVLRARAGGDGGAIEGVKSFKEKLPDYKGLTKVLGEVFTAAKKNGLKIPEGDYRPETVKDTDISRYTFSFPVEGRYSQIKKFIYDIETLDRMLVVEEVTLSTGKAEDGTVALNIRMSAYYL